MWPAIFRKSRSRSMSAKTTIDLLCNSCGAEYMITFDYDEVIEEAEICPFCGSHIDDYGSDENADYDE